MSDATPPPPAAARARAPAAAPAPNFLRTLVADDMRTGKYGGRVVTRRILHWADREGAGDRRF